MKGEHGARIENRRALAWEHSGQLSALGSSALEKVQESPKRDGSAWRDGAQEGQL